MAMRLGCIVFNFFRKVNIGLFEINNVFDLQLRLFPVVFILLGDPKKNIKFLRIFVCGKQIVYVYNTLPILCVVRLSCIETNTPQSLSYICFTSVQSTLPGELFITPTPWRTQRVKKMGRLMNYYYNQYCYWEGYRGS